MKILLNFNLKFPAIFDEICSPGGRGIYTCSDALVNISRFQGVMSPLIDKVSQGLADEKCGFLFSYFEKCCEAVVFHRRVLMCHCSICVK